MSTVSPGDEDIRERFSVDVLLVPDRDSAQATMETSMFDFGIVRVYATRSRYYYWCVVMRDGRSRFMKYRSQ